MTRAHFSHILALVLVAGCNQSDFDMDEGVQNPDGPGTPQWGDSDVTCKADSDCNFGEACTAGVCQMKRCGDGNFESIAPFGAKRTFVRDREIVVADATISQGAYWADGYLPSSSSLTYPTGGGSWNGGAAKITDVAGGGYMGTGPEMVAIARTGLSSVSIPAINKTVQTGFVPVAIAGGDVDHDGKDDVVAIGATGQVSICNVDKGSCVRKDVSAEEAYDVAVGDVDGDGVEEAVYHLYRDGEYRLVMVNFDAGTTGQPASTEIVTDFHMGLAIADLDGNGRGEIVALTDGGWLGFGDDVLTTFTSNGYSIAQGATVDTNRTNTVDIAGGDIDRDQKGEIVMLTDDRIAHMLRGTGLVQAYESTLAASSAPNKITTVDFDGDSSVGRLIAAESGKVVPGEVVPTMVLYMPPYYDTMSASAASITAGNTIETEEGRTDSVGLSVGVTFGVSGEIPLIVEAEIGIELNNEATYSKTFAKSISIANRYEVESDPTQYGNDIAAVVLSCGCFHQYTYQLDSPVVGGNGEKFVVLLPVGGTTQLWSSKRYNAMAEAVGTLPIVTVPHRVGDPRSYPTEAVRADGMPIAPEDLVFTSSSPIRVSDIAEVEWELAAGSTQTNGAAMATSVTASASVTVTGIEVGGSIGLEWEQGYEVSVGESVEFGGVVPPIPNDPKTPEDEYATYVYGFKPTVYREHYKRGDGSSAAYYVVNYSVEF